MRSPFEHGHQIKSWRRGGKDNESEFKSKQKRAKTKRKELAVFVPSSSVPSPSAVPFNQLSHAPWLVLGLALAPSTGPFENGKYFSEVVGGSGRQSSGNHKTKEKELTRSFRGRALPSWAVSSSDVASSTFPSTVLSPAYPSRTTPQS